MCAGGPREAMRRQSGFSLAEVLVSLALVSMIGLAGVSLLTSLAAVQSRLDARYAALTELDLFFEAVTAQLMQADPESLTQEAGALRFETQGCAGRTGAEIAMREATAMSAVGACPHLSARLPGIASLDFDLGTTATALSPAASQRGDRDSIRSVRVSVTFIAQPGLPKGEIWKRIDLPESPAP